MVTRVRKYVFVLKKDVMFLQDVLTETPKPTMKIPTNKNSLKTKLVQTKPITFNVIRNMTESPEPDLVPSNILYTNAKEFTTKQPNGDSRRFSTAGENNESFEKSSKNRSWIKVIIILLSVVVCVLLVIHIALLTIQRKCTCS
uniref:Uncharacterized protein LOC111100247 n=1 Tax=Crassostrea virginica TaxID=6565 RepID=A0A8B8A864_CRAVI|nr:uncharacterized protein LOC111100247 [Crassostrea virginica]